MVLGLRGVVTTPGDLMAIVETDQALAFRVMQGQGVVESVWLIGRHRHPVDDEFDPVAGFIDHQDLPI